MTITSSTNAPLVVIGGVTGNQGRSVLDNLQASDRPYRMRGLTRDASKPKAAELEKLGVEMISIDLKPGNEEAMREAYKGADVVFCVTNFWEHVDKEREIAEGKAMIDAAIAAGVDLFIFSSLPSPSKWSDGKYTQVHHFEGKAEIATYGLERAKSTPSFHFRTVEAGFYNTNVLGGLNIYKDDEGVWKFPAPIDMQTCSPLPTIDIPKDYGLWVRAVIEREEVRNDSRPVLVSGEDVHVLDLLKQLGQAAGIEIQAERVTVEKFAEVLKGSPQHIIDDLSENWPYMAEFGFFGGQDVHWVDQYLARRPTTFKEWCESADLSHFEE